MHAHITFYTKSETEIGAHWSSPRPPGWVDEGGWLWLRNPYGPPDNDPSAGIVIYLDRAQALRLRRVVDELIDRMPAQDGPDNVEITVTEQGVPSVQPSNDR
jgi:hypothetical protein